MNVGTSYLIPSLEFAKAVREAQKRVKAHPLGDRGLEFICAAPLCEITDPMIEFVHPKSGYRMHLCPGHNRMLRYEMRKMGHKMATLEQYLHDLRQENGGALRFAAITALPKLLKPAHS